MAIAKPVAPSSVAASLSAGEPLFRTRASSLIPDARDVASLARKAELLAEGA